MKKETNTKQMFSNIPEINQRYLNVLKIKKYSGYRLAKESDKISEAKLTHIRSGRNEPSKEMISGLIEIFPDINYNWLLTGTGEMLTTSEETESTSVFRLDQNRKTKDANVEIQEVPLYDLEATAGLVEFFRGDKSSNLLDTIKIPNIPRCDGAIFVTGDSMYPLLKSGDIVLYREIPVNIESIFFGEMYLLGVRIDEWEEMITVKYVQRSDLGNDYVKLVSQNQHHQPKDIPLKNITAMAMVKVSIRINTMN